MFCEKCGTKLPDAAEFCINCGTNIRNTGKIEKKITDTEIQLRVKPSFKFGYMILPSLIFWGILILFISFVFGIASEEGLVGVLCALVCFSVIGIILAIKTAFIKKQYSSYCYDFYKTKVVYKDSFLNLSEKEVKYKYIREVTMRQTFIQRFFNIGHIVLFTNAETGYGNGIFIMNVENVQNVYRDIKSVIDV